MIFKGARNPSFDADAIPLSSSCLFAAPAAAAAAAVDHEHRRVTLFPMKSRSKGQKYPFPGHHDLECLHCVGVSLAKYFSMICIPAHVDSGQGDHERKNIPPSFSQSPTLSFDAMICFALVKNNNSTETSQDVPECVFFCCEL